MVQKIGVVTFMTNATTAVGFLVLAFTKSPMLREFGVVAGINILATFFVSIIVVPAFFSYLPEPNQRHTHYLDRKWMEKLTRRIAFVVLRKRKYVYAFTILLIAAAVVGAGKLRAIGYVLDDVPKEKKVYKDLKFFENNFGGVLPFEVVVTARDPKGINNLDVLERMSIFQDTLESLPHVSRTYSVADVAKASRMAFFNNNPGRWGIPNTRERSYILPYLQNSNENAGLLENLVDSTGQIGRISLNIADIGSVKTTQLLKRLTDVGNQVFEGQASVSFTGVSLLFIKSNEYLIKSLINSMLLAFAIISILMGFMFKDFRMVLASLIPNLIPLVITAGIMGFAGIPLKPSTVLVFSIAFGISIDDALHFLAKYRQELNQHNWPSYRIISVAITETGPSMMYTSIVLFAGFSIFALSDFGGTAALGYLLSVTLLVAMFTNLIVLPSLILTFINRKGKAKG
jgi:predicted RND superfamily exporter protein